jgi:hypothetical protein
MVAIQVDFARFANAMGTNGARLARIEQMGSVNYITAFEPVNTNYEWRLAYVNMFSDMKNATVLANEQTTEASGRGNHIAVMEILKAYTLLTLVDYYGDVPLSEANNLSDFPQPTVDTGSSVYEAAITMLDNAISRLGLLGNLDLENDFYYNNNWDQWKKLANTLKMQAYVNTRLTDPSAMGKFNTLVAGNNFISETTDDFEFEYNILINDEIDARAPGYQSDYTAGGVTRYRSDWLMNRMLRDNDPRRRYYFFRQNDCTPGALKDFTLPADHVFEDGTLNQCATDPERLFCSTQPKPGPMVFCSVDNGYWGRDHGFGGGIPPDTFKRTAGGVYPIAGNFDDNRFSSVGIGQGGGGAGIAPLYLASWSHLMLAEMALHGGSGDAGASLAAAMTRSIKKVQSFGSRDGDADLATTDDGGYVPTDATVSDYITNKVNLFNSVSPEERMNVLGQQHFVAHYGNGTNSYNFYRRTGYPNTVQFTVDPNPGKFVRSFFYPADEANTNPNIAQKANVNVKVFWDNNPDSAQTGGFPSAN